jgi:translation initiation factor IF-2
MRNKKKVLEIVLKCDSVGTQEAVVASLSDIQRDERPLKVIHAGVGAVAKSDLLLALTGSRIVLGFNVDIGPKIKELCREQEIEVRLYDVIYRLVADMKEIADSLVTPKEEERITGKANVIALFKTGRKGIILGCEVLEGTLAVGKRFRLISPMGPTYTGKIESLQIERDTVQEATAGQQVGLKVLGLKRARVGDRVECFEHPRPKADASWHPKGGVFKIP